MTANKKIQKMNNISLFCTCNDTSCPLNPVNHDKGCSLCIQKNLQRREIPNCFFHLAGSTEKRASYSFKDFAELVVKN